MPKEPPCWDCPEYQELLRSRVRSNPDGKFDLQLDQALIDERRLAEIFEHLDIHTVELKSESHLWERTGNICIEYGVGREGGEYRIPSGIATTEATCWAHELKRDGRTLVYLLFPVERLKELARAAIRAGNCRHDAGDGKKFSIALVALSDILR